MKCSLSLAPFLVLAIPAVLIAGPIVIDFEGLPDGTPLTSQYPGVVFSNATVLTAGISLNEFEFPPFSGSNIAFDDGGPLSIWFLAPALSFGGHFTYSVPITLTAFDSSDNPLAFVNSLFSSNLALSGDPGSSPNEFLAVTLASSISRVTITGDPAGASFSLDDATYDTVIIPEATTLALACLGGITVMLLRRRRR